MPQDNNKQQGGAGVKQATRVTIDKPLNYKVIMLNDDVTTMEFVVEVLETVFHKSTAEATTLMLLVHTTGEAVVGIYSLDIARTRRMKAVNMARAAGFPLQINIEPEG